MGRNKDLRLRIAGQLKVIENHEDKIREERTNRHPDEDAIESWQREIQTAKNRIKKLTRRLKRQW